MSITVKSFVPIIPALAMFLPASANAENAKDARVAQMQVALQACGNVTASRTIEICESSLSDVLTMRPKLEFTGELVISYFAETALRDMLSNAYFGQQNLNKHCENVEKMWALRQEASPYAEHPVFPELSNLAMARKVDVATCRRLGGTPEWGAPL